MSQLAIKNFSLTSFHIKVVAALLMVIDHIGLVYEIEWMRIVGRFSFPLFAWLLVQGAKHTQSYQRYERRLLILALLSQLFYALFVASILPLNSVFQLWLGLVLFRLVRAQQMTSLLWVAIIGVATLFFDYQYYGIGLIYLMSSYPLLLPNSPIAIDFRVNAVLWVAAFVLLHLCYSSSHPLQIFAFPFIFLLPVLNRIEKRGLKARWFYWFYPVHFIPLTLLKGF